MSRLHRNYLEMVSLVHVNPFDVINPIHDNKQLMHGFYLLEKIVMNVSASLDVKMGSGSSLKYCFSMSAMS